MDDMETLKGKVYGLTVIVGLMPRSLADSASQTGNDSGRIEALLDGMDDPISRLPADLQVAARKRRSHFIDGFIDVHRDLSAIIGSE